MLLLTAYTTLHLLRSFFFYFLSHWTLEVLSAAEEQHRKLQARKQHAVAITGAHSTGQATPPNRTSGPASRSRNSTFQAANGDADSRVSGPNERISSVGTSIPVPMRRRSIDHSVMGPDDMVPAFNAMRRASDGVGALALQPLALLRSMRKGSMTGLLASVRSLHHHDSHESDDTTFDGDHAVTVIPAGTAFDSNAARRDVHGVVSASDNGNDTFNAHHGRSKSFRRKKKQALQTWFSQHVWLVRQDVLVALFLTSWILASLPALLAFAFTFTDMGSQMSDFMADDGSGGDSAVGITTGLCATQDLGFTGDTLTSIANALWLCSLAPAAVQLMLTAWLGYQTDATADSWGIRRETIVTAVLGLPVLCVGGPIQYALGYTTSSGSSLAALLIQLFFLCHAGLTSVWPLFNSWQRHRERTCDLL